MIDNGSNHTDPECRRTPSRGGGPIPPLDFSVDSEVREAVAAQVDSTESVLWIGQPDRHASFRAAVPLSIIGIVITIIAVAWTVVVVRLGAGDIAWLYAFFGAPFLIVGLLLIAAPSWAARRASRTIYAITDSRALILLGGPEGPRRVQTYTEADVREIHVNECRASIGDVTFAHRSETSDNGRSREWSVGFFRIRNVRQVEELLRRVFKRPESGETTPE